MQQTVKKFVDKYRILPVFKDNGGCLLFGSTDQTVLLLLPVFTFTAGNKSTLAKVKKRSQKQGMENGEKK